MNCSLLKMILVLVLLLTGAVAVNAAGPMFWDWHGAKDLDGVRLEGAALDADGALVRGLVARATGPAGADVYWCLADDGDGGFYSGSGHGGEIHHTRADGEVRLLAQVPATEVFSLLVPEQGGLLAGCGPEGQLYRISEDGTPLELGVVPGGYIWDLLLDPDGKTTWLATGSPAAVWRLDDDGNLAEYAALDAQNVLDLALDSEGRLLAATQGPGLVYRLSRTGDPSPRVLFEAPQNEVRQFLNGPDGAIHALALQVEEQVTTSADKEAVGMLQVLNGHKADNVPRSALYLVEGDAPVKPVWTGDVDVMIAAWSPVWGWLAGGVMDEDSQTTRLLGLLPPSGTHPVAGWIGGDVLALMMDDERILAAQAHPGAVVTLVADEGPHRALARPVDAGRPVRWGRLRWDGSGDLKGVRWSVRGGNRTEPDGSWTEWSSDWSDGDKALGLPPSRFLQWRVEFPAGSSDARVTGVSLSGWRDNLPPSIAKFREERVTKMQEGGLVPRGENVTQTMSSGLKVEFSRPSLRSLRAAPDRADRIRPVRTFSWQGNDPDGDRVVWTLEFRREEGTTWRPIVARTVDNLGSWDTTDLPDGIYRVRLTASDEADNPIDLAHRVRRELGSLRVDNTPPRVEDMRLDRADTGFRVRFRATDGDGVLGGAQVVLPDGSLQRLDPVDLICDSDREDFDQVITWPPSDRPGGVEPWHLRVEVRDLSGNLAQSEGEVR